MKYSSGRKKKEVKRPKRRLRADASQLYSQEDPYIEVQDKENAYILARSDIAAPISTDILKPNNRWSVHQLVYCLYISL